MKTNDVMNITFFCITTVIAIIGLMIVTKIKLPVWKIQIVLISFFEFLAVLFLIHCLTRGQ